jgi:hypothetical protein
MHPSRSGLIYVAGRFVNLRALCPSAGNEFDKTMRATPLDIITVTAYKNLRNRLLTVKTLLDSHKDLKEADRHELVDRIAEISKSTDEGRTTSWRAIGSLKSATLDWLGSRPKISPALQSLYENIIQEPMAIPQMTDAEFLVSLDTIVAEEPLLKTAAAQARREAHVFLKISIDRLSAKLCRLIQAAQHQALIRQSHGTTDFAGEARQAARHEFLQEIEKASQAPLSPYVIGPIFDYFTMTFFDFRCVVALNFVQVNKGMTQGQ